MVGRVSIPLGPTSDTWRGPALLASGHRPFFLFAGVYGAGALAMWLLAWRGLLPLTSSWHGHEMIFGFAVAAIAGFLLAAVPKWTHSPPYRGARVAVLMALWLAGRLGMWLAGAGAIGPSVGAVLDLLFLPALAWFIGAAILRARNHRNYQVPVVLLAVWGLDVFYHFGNPSLALRVAVYAIATLVTLISGRIVPAFTRNALRQAGHPDVECHTPRWLDVAAVPVMVVVTATELAWPSSRWSGIAAAVAAVVLGGRMVGWHTWLTRPLPLVWVLHVGYAFLPFAMIMKAIADLGGPVGSFAALHALTAGAIGVMILAVASRAALGHSGRPLVPAPATVVAYGLVIAGALLRVLVLHPHATLAAGVLWSAGYAVFSVVYWPMLTRPRSDGQPG